MKGVLQDSLYAIYDTQTAKFLKFGNKIGWATAAYAKLAYAYHNRDSTTRKYQNFDNQQRYVVVNIDAKHFKEH